MNSKTFRQLVDAGEQNFGEVLAALLVSSVPRSFLDSGGSMSIENGQIVTSQGYGTATDRNRLTAQVRQLTPHDYFEQQEASSFWVDKWGLNWSHSIYHWLKEKVTYRADVTRQFYDFMDFAYAHENRGHVPVWEKQSDRHRRGSWWGRMQVHENSTDSAEFFLKHIWKIWPEQPQDWDDLPQEEWQARWDMLEVWLKEYPECPYTFLNGEGEYTANTYNGEDMLSQVMQYYSFPEEHNWLYAIAIHGGGDVRGGYHDIIICEGNEGWYDLADNARGYLDCSNSDCDACWDTDNAGYHIYDGNGDYEDFPGQNDDEFETFIQEHAERDAEGEMTGRLMCPCCKTGVLHAGF